MSHLLDIVYHSAKAKTQAQKIEMWASILFAVHENPCEMADSGCRQTRLGISEVSSPQLCGSNSRQEIDHEKVTEHHKEATRIANATHEKSPTVFRGQLRWYLAQSRERAHLYRV